LIGGATMSWSGGWLAGKEEVKIPEYIRVEVCGVLKHGVFAIGGETTGAEITANRVTWELDFHGDDELRSQAETLNGKSVVVRGELEKRAGVERPARWIVQVKEFKAAE
ncbi:MAG TPA: hypothetical protein VGE52_07100, partial [Pirellulales bacterium]